MIGNAIWIGKSSDGAVVPDGTPSNLVLTVISDTEIDGSFTVGSTNQDGHYVYMSSDGGLNYSLKATLSGTTATFQATGLTTNTLYYFKVCAYKGTQKSAYCTPVAKTTSGELGTLFLDGFDSLSANWIQTGIGTGTLSVGSGNLTYTKTGTVGWNSYIYYNGIGMTQLENWEFEVVQICSLESTTKYGLVYGLRSDPAFHITKQIMGILDMTTSATKGKLLIYDGTATSYNSGTTVLAMSDGDRIRIRFSRNIEVFTIYAKNLTTDSAEISLSHTFVWNDAVETMITIAYPCIYSLTGAKQIEYFKFSSTSKRNPYVCFLGDSITSGYEVSATANRCVSLFGAHTTKSYTVLACQATMVNEYTSGTLTELATINPAKVVILLGANDIIHGDSEATIESRYTTLINGIVALGITPIICKLVPYTPVDVRTFNSWLQSTYGGTYTIIDLFTPLHGAGYEWNAAYGAPGGVHPNDAGHTVIYNTIVAAVPDLL